MVTFCRCSATKGHSCLRRIHSRSDPTSSNQPDTPLLEWNCLMPNAGEEPGQPCVLSSPSTFFLRLRDRSRTFNDGCDGTGDSLRQRGQNQLPAETPQALGTLLQCARWTVRIWGETELDTRNGFIYTPPFGRGPESIQYYPVCLAARSFLPKIPSLAFSRATHSSSTALSR